MAHRDRLPADSPGRGARSLQSTKAGNIRQEPTLAASVDRITKPSPQKRTLACALPSGSVG